MADPCPAIADGMKASAGMAAMLRFAVAVDERLANMGGIIVDHRCPTASTMHFTAIFTFESGIVRLAFRIGAAEGSFEIVGGDGRLHLINPHDMDNGLADLHAIFGARTRH